MGVTEGTGTSTEGTGAGDDAPTSVEDFIAGKNGKKGRAPVAAVKGGPVEISSRDKFLAKVQDTSKPEPLEIHGETVMTRGLSARERSEARTLATDPDGKIDGFVLECAYVSVGMVEPAFTIEELSHFTEGWLDPIYYRILDQTTMREKATTMGVDGPAPLVQTSGFARISQTATIGRGRTS